MEIFLFSPKALFSIYMRVEECVCVSVSQRASMYRGKTSAGISCFSL